jgi:AcrR family transcriptional regulator
LTEQRAILEATSALLRDRGFAGVTTEEVAAQAGVTATTLYRRWRSMSELVVELLRDRAEIPSEPPDTGELRGDLVLVLGQLVEVVHRLGAVGASVMGAAARDPELANELRLFVFSWQEPLRQLVKRGIERGELPMNLDEDTAVDLAASIVWFRRMLLGDRAWTGLSERLADPILRAWGYNAERARVRKSLRTPRPCVVKTSTPPRSRCSPKNRRKPVQRGAS